MNTQTISSVVRSPANQEGKKKKKEREREKWTTDKEEKKCSQKRK